MSRLAYQLTPEQLAKREERKLKKLAEGNPKAAQHEYSLLALPNHEMGRVLTRPWVTVGALRQSSVQNVTVKTWNVRVSLVLADITADV